MAQHGAAQRSMALCYNAQHIVALHRACTAWLRADTSHRQQTNRGNPPGGLLHCSARHCQSDGPSMTCCLHTWCSQHKCHRPMSTHLISRQSMVKPALKSARVAPSSDAYFSSHTSVWNCVTPARISTSRPTLRVHTHTHTQCFPGFTFAPPRGWGHFSHVHHHSNTHTTTTLPASQT